MVRSDNKAASWSKPKARGINAANPCQKGGYHIYGWPANSVNPLPALRFSTRRRCRHGSNRGMLWALRKNSRIAAPTAMRIARRTRSRDPNLGVSLSSNISSRGMGSGLSKAYSRGGLKSRPATLLAPIIILQSDQGPKALTHWESATATHYKEALAILNAVCLPGKNYRDFYPDISPINSLMDSLNQTV